MTMYMMIQKDTHNTPELLGVLARLHLLAKAHKAETAAIQVLRWRKACVKARSHQ